MVAIAAVLVLVATTVSLVLTAEDASAHALLVNSDPPVDAQLLDPPTAITGFFSEPLDSRLSSLQVVDAAGERYDSGETTFGPDDAQMSIDIPQELSPAFYIVIWETLSDIDGHLIKGSFPFTVLNPDGSQPSGAKPTDIGVTSGGDPTWDVVSAKWTVLSAAIVLVGSVAFVIWVVRPASKDLDSTLKRRVRAAGRRHLRWIAWPAVALLVLAGGAEVLIQARVLGGLEFIDEALDTFWGRRWIQRQFVLGAIALSLGLSFWLLRAGRDRLSEAALWVALGGGLAYLLLLSMIGHGGSLDGVFWAVGADFAHLIGAAVWIGMLVQLALLFLWSRQNLSDRERPTVLASHLRRFSALAATSVIILLASGAVSALSHIPHPEAMIDTAYGRVLTAKLALMGILLLVAGANAVLLSPRLIRLGPEAGDALRDRLSTLIQIEAAIAVAVVLVAAVLIQYPTARQERDAAANVQISTEAVVGFEEARPAGDIVANLGIAPNAVGTNSFQVFLFPTAGGELGEVLRVRLRFKPPNPDLGPSETITEAVNLNFFKAVGAFFTMPGEWEVQVDVRRRDLDDVSAFFPVEVVGTGPAVGGSQFALPLVSGSWITVGAVGVLLTAILMAVWAAQWPRIPERVTRPLRVGSTAFGVFGVAFLAVSLLPTEEVTSGNPISPTATSVALGRGLYAENCAQCHGDEGKGDGPLAETLAVPPADFDIHIPLHTDEFFFRVMTNGLGDIMPGFGTVMSEDDLWNMLNFLKSEHGLDAQSNDQ
jgi:copper transport protein